MFVYEKKYSKPQFLLCLAYHLSPVSFPCRAQQKDKYVGDPSVSLSLTLGRNDKVKHYIRIKTHKLIALRFWVESGVIALCDWTQVSLVLCLPSETSFVNLTSSIRALKLTQTSTV